LTEATYRRRRLEPSLQRARRFLQRLRGGFDKRQRVYAVDIAGTRLKHLVLPDACVAGEIAQNLEDLAPLGIFPRLVARYRNELWMEYVEGSAVDGSAPAPLEELAVLFAALYKLDTRVVAREARHYDADVARDIALLTDFAVIDRPTADRLAALAARGAPAHAWVGYDYNDPRPQNFLRTPGGALRVLDVESIRRDVLIGTGVARACVRWPDLDRERFLARLREHGAPDFTHYLSFLELAFAASWTKRCVLQRKGHLIDRAIFERLAARAADGKP
jgi:hypothetical protein